MLANKSDKVSIELRISDDGKWYYAEGYATSHGVWLSTGTFPQKPKGGFMDGVAQFNTPHGPYYRRFLPFAFYKVDAILLKRERVHRSNILAGDYLTVISLVNQSQQS